MLFSNSQTAVQVQNYWVFRGRQSYNTYTRAVAFLNFHMGWAGRIPESVDVKVEEL